MRNGARRVVCGHAINEPDGIFVVEDAIADPRFFDNPLVVGPPHVRFFAGAPIRTPEGFALGSISVIDHVTRTLSAEQISTLQMAAQSIVALLAPAHARRATRMYGAPATPLGA